jgi:hypothetical protein
VRWDAERGDEGEAGEPPKAIREKAEACGMFASADVEGCIADGEGTSIGGARVDTATSAGIAAMGGGSGPAGRVLASGEWRACAIAAAGIAISGALALKAPCARGIAATLILIGDGECEELGLQRSSAAGLEGDNCNSLPDGFEGEDAAEAARVPATLVSSMLLV